MALLAPLTTAVDFLAMCLSLWLGIYIVTRSPRSSLAWLASLTLLLLAPLFLDSLLSINPVVVSDRWFG